MLLNCDGVALTSQHTDAAFSSTGVVRVVLFGIVRLVRCSA